jgi:thiosulfate dehydrogenase
MQRRIVYTIIFVITIGLILLSVVPSSEVIEQDLDTIQKDGGIEWPWNAPDTATIPNTTEGDLIRYGRELVAHTAVYLGPQGKVAKKSNGMNCQNCHLDAGTKPWGINYAAVASGYPRFKERSGTTETLVKKINDCFERSLNGKPLDSASHEMLAMVAYMKWVGKEVQKGEKPLGNGITTLKFLDRAANPVAGSEVFVSKCLRCHGAEGQGLIDTITGIGYSYPPLWGKNSYNIGASLYRVSRFAGFVKDNMPFGVAHGREELTDEEAWDVAAYVNSQDRPGKDLSEDWPDISTKPMDHPFGPFSDSFSEKDHKYGPWGKMKKK